MGAPLRAMDPFGTGTAIGGIAQAAGSVASAGIQADAANHAADLSSQASANSLGFNKDVWNQQQENTKPWLDAGKGALGQLASMTSPGGSLVTPYGKSFDAGPAFDGGPAFDAGPAFKAPTTVDEQNDPGYQFRLQQSQQAIERSAAARGGVMGGGVLKDLANYQQGLASQEYGNVYNRALQGYQTNFGNNLAAYQTNFGDKQSAYQTNFNSNLGSFNTNYNEYNTDQSNQFNRLASIAGLGQNANGQLNSAGTAAAENFSSTSMTGANNAGNYLTQGGSAYGSGALGVGNAIANIGASQNQQYQQAYANATNPNYGPYGTYTGGGTYNVPQQPGYSDTEAWV